MEEVHIKMESDEALFIKRELLASQMNALEILKGIKEYKALKSAEVFARGKLKKTLDELKKQVIDLKNSFPNQEEQKEQLKILEELYKKKYARKRGIKEETVEEEEEMGGEEMKEEEEEAEEEVKGKRGRKTAPVKVKEKASPETDANLELIESELKSIKEKLDRLG